MIKTCPNCGRNISLKPNLQPEPYKGYEFFISEVKIPTCEGCGEQFINPSLAKEIDAALENAYQKLKVKSFDKGIAIGDLITAYHKGFWIVMEVEKRFVTKDLLAYESYKSNKVGDEISSLIYYKKFADTKFKPSKGTSEQNCEETYCEKVDVKLIEKEIKESKTRIKNLKRLIKRFKIDQAIKEAEESGAYEMSEHLSGSLVD